MMTISKKHSSDIHDDDDDDDKDDNVCDTTETNESSSTSASQQLVHRFKGDTDYDSDGENNPFLSSDSSLSRTPTKGCCNWLITIPTHYMRILLNSTHIEFITMTILFLTNTMLWYFTNGMNGISMQSFASSLHERNLLIDPNNTSLTMNDLSLTSVVTYLQLLMGAILGTCILFVLSCFIHRNPQQSQHEGQSMPFTSKLLLYYPFLTKTLSWKTSDLLLSSLHGIGSLATNLGFVYGSASLVQILKLIEPFETLILTMLCSPDESKLLSIGIVSSMTTVTLAAISLVKQRKTKPHPASILFALCSGFTLSSRNVLQRRWYSTQEKEEKKSKNSDGIEMTSKVNVKDIAATKLEEGLSSLKDSESSKEKDSNEATDDTDTLIKSDDAKITTSSSSAPNQHVVRLEQSIIQYTQLSIQSGVMLLVMTTLQ